jgi:hypothetical protein
VNMFHLLRWSHRPVVWIQKHLRLMWDPPHKPTKMEIRGSEVNIEGLGNKPDPNKMDFIRLRSWR